MGLFDHLFGQKQQNAPPARATRIGGGYLNQVAQGLKPFDECSARFEASLKEEQIAALSMVEFMADQASATGGDSAAAIAAAQLGSDFKPAWVPSDSCIHIPTDYAQVSDLPNQFRYLMRLFEIADTRRRKECGPHCNHWWHHLDKQ
jgi:hypothetical protein